MSGIACKMRFFQLSAVMCLIVCPRFGTSSRIIAVPLPGAPSHVYAMHKICDQLIDRGHEVLMVLAKGDVHSLSTWDSKRRIKVEAHETAYDESQWREQSRLARFKDPVSGGIVGVKMWAHTCDVLLTDAGLLKRLEEYQAQLVLGDWAYFCQLAIAEKLKLPRVTFSNVPIIDPVHTTWDRSTGRRMNIPNILAIHNGVIGIMQGFTGRIKNAVSYIIIQFVDYFIFHKMIYQPLGRKHNIDMGSRDALRRGVINMFNVDFAIEYPRPLVPNVKLIGPVMPREPQELPRELQEFYNLHGESGIVYVSFGTVCSLEKQELKEIAVALSALTAGVLWKMDPAELPDMMGISDLDIGSNIKVVKWAPQNDVLGHPQTRGFLTHGGINGLYEAAYHATPLIGIPMIADQLDNVMKAVHHGFGLLVSAKKGIRAKDISRAMQTIFESNKYQEAATRVSQRLRSRVRKPAEEGADWVEHVLNTDGDPYLQTPEDDLSVIALYGWDVAIVLSLPFLVPAVLALFFRFMSKKRARQSSEILNSRQLVLDSQVGVHARVTIKGGSSKDKTV